MRLYEEGRRLVVACEGQLKDAEQRLRTAGTAAEAAPPGPDDPDEIPFYYGNMTIRRFAASDAPAVCEIFYRSVRDVASREYTRAQVKAWAPAVPDPERWLPNLLEYTTCVAEDEQGTVVAWAAMTGDGYIDMLFCAPEAVGKGFASALYAAIEAEASRCRIPRLTAHASLLAQPFFAKRGWVIDRHEDVVRNGVSLPRAAMSKRLSA